MQDVADRIQWILQEFSLTASEFAERVGIQASAVTHFLNRRNAPSYLVTCAILRAFPTLQAEWFMLGAGEALKSSPVPGDQTRAAVRQPLPASPSTLFAGHDTAADASIHRSTSATAVAPTRGETAAQDESTPSPSAKSRSPQPAASPEPEESPQAVPGGKSPSPALPPLPTVDPACASDAKTEEAPARYAQPDSPTPSPLDTPVGARTITDVNTESPRQVVRSEESGYYAEGARPGKSQPSATPAALPMPRRVLLLYPDGTFEFFTPRADAGAQD